MKSGPSFVTLLPQCCSIICYLEELQMLTSEGTQSEHLCRGSAPQLFCSAAPEAITPLRMAPSLPRGQRTGVGPPQKVFPFPFLGPALEFAVTFQQ